MTQIKDSPLFEYSFLKSMRYVNQSFTIILDDGGIGQFFNYYRGKNLKQLLEDNSFSLKPIIETSVWLLFVIQIETVEFRELDA